MLSRTKDGLASNVSKGPKYEGEPSSIVTEAQKQADVISNGLNQMEVDEVDEHPVDLSKRKAELGRASLSMHLDHRNPAPQHPHPPSIRRPPNTTPLRPRPRPAVLGPATLQRSISDPLYFSPPPGSGAGNLSKSKDPAGRILAADIHHNYGFFTILSSPTTDDLSPTKEISSETEESSGQSEVPSFFREDGGGLERLGGESLQNPKINIEIEKETGRETKTASFPHYFMHVNCVEERRERERPSKCEIDLCKISREFDAVLGIIEDEEKKSSLEKSFLEESSKKKSAWAPMWKATPKSKSSDTLSSSKDKDAKVKKSSLRNSSISKNSKKRVVFEGELPDDYQGELARKNTNEEEKWKKKEDSSISSKVSKSNIHAPNVESAGMQIPHQQECSIRKECAMRKDSCDGAKVSNGDAQRAHIRSGDEDEVPDSFLQATLWAQPVSNITYQHTKALYKPKFGDGPRVALCIGIDDYPGKSKLPNCVADAEDMGALCEQKLGFALSAVKVLRNADKNSIMKAVQELRDEHAKDGSLIVFYFSGHGVEYNGVSYLLPLGMESNKEEDYSDEAVSVDEIMRLFSRFTSAVNVILLDCCRENDRNHTFKKTKGRLDHDNTKSFGDHLRSRTRNAEFLVGLACDGGTCALPNDGARNSFYTEALLRHLPVPDRQIEESLKEVSKDVFKKTKKEQRPWQNHCLHEEVFLVTGKCVTGQNPDLRDKGVGEGGERSRKRPSVTPPPRLSPLDMDVEEIL